MADALLPVRRGQQFLDARSSDSHSGGSPALSDDPLVVLSVQDFLQKTLPAREEMLSPWLLTQSLNLIHSWRGVGKTHVALGIAYAVASGGAFLNWSAVKPRKVLYIDGEMPACALQERLADITVAAGLEPDPGMLRVITPDLQCGPMPDLATASGQEAVNTVLQDTELLVLDNLSCLARSGGRENDAESWLPVAQWALQMRTRGRSVLFIHHSAKGGQQRGTSKREDLLDTVLRLKEPADYRHGEGARFEVHYEKARHLHGEATRPIEAQLTTDEDHHGRWTFREVEETTFDRVVSLANEGLSRPEVALELECNRSTVHRHWRRAEAQGLIQSSPTGAKRGKR
jgi:hypothetical protein